MHNIKINCEYFSADCYLRLLRSCTNCSCCAESEREANVQKMYFPVTSQNNCGGKREARKTPSWKPDSTLHWIVISANNALERRLRESIRLHSLPDFCHTHCSVLKIEQRLWAWKRRMHHVLKLWTGTTAGGELTERYVCFTLEATEYFVHQISEADLLTRAVDSRSIRNSAVVRVGHFSNERSRWHQCPTKDEVHGFQPRHSFSKVSWGVFKKK